MNRTNSIEDYCIGGGNQNNGTYGSNFFCGLNNIIPNTNARSGTYLYGQNLHISKAASGPQHLVVLGRGSNTNIHVPNTKSSLGAAITGGGSRNFNIECYPTFTKLDLPIRLLADDTEVDAITRPLDPNNVTQDDRTLVTKSNLPAPLLTSATNLSEDAPTLDLSTVWNSVRDRDQNIRFYIRINGVDFESTFCNCKNADGYLQFERDAYDAAAQSTTIYQYKFAWDHNAKTLTYIELFSYKISDAGAISDVSHALTGAVITVYRVESF